jgi:hypothetical protein
MCCTEEVSQKYMPYVILFNGAKDAMQTSALGVTPLMIANLNWLLAHAYSVRRNPEKQNRRA